LHHLEDGEESTHEEEGVDTIGGTTEYLAHKGLGDTYRVRVRVRVTEEG